MTPQHGACAFRALHVSVCARGTCRVAGHAFCGHPAHQLCCLSFLLCAVQSGANTIAPGSQTISVDEGTVVAVAWLPENSTAWFSWRGSVSKKDWLADFQLW